MILITRPKDKALKLESKLSKYGYQCFVESLSEIKFINLKVLVKRDHVLLISSPRTVSHVIKYMSDNLSIKLLVIGLSSFEKLKQAGFRNLIFGAKNSNDMIKFLRKSEIKRISYLTGTIRNKNVTTKIREMGISIQEDIIYETKFKKKLSSKCISLIKLKKIKIVLIYSIENAKHIIYVLNKALIKKASKSLIFVCLSKNIAKELTVHGYQANYAKLPTEASLIRKLIDMS